jgi:hypothetical protein
MGNRRGKRVGAKRAEKKAAPVIRNFEKQVKDLSERINIREQQIKTAAIDKMNALFKAQDRQKLMDRMTQPEVHSTAQPAERPAPAQVDRAPAPAVNAPELAAAAVAGLAGVAGAAAIGERLPAAARPAGEVYSRSAESQSRLPAQTELLISERYKQEAVANIVPFNKRAEQFTDDELMMTAEKIKVEGVSLKEMTELGRLDEKSLRRVVDEFLQGGDVSRAVAKEVKEKELKYERDPTMRQQASGGGGQEVSGGSQAAGGILAVGGARSSDGSDASGSGEPGSTYNGSKPTPDAATLAAIRNKQITTVAGTTVAVIMAVIILTLLI